MTIMKGRDKAFTQRIEKPATASGQAMTGEDTDLERCCSSGHTLVAIRLQLCLDFLQI